MWEKSAARDRITGGAENQASPNAKDRPGARSWCARDEQEKLGLGTPYRTLAFVQHPCGHS